MVIKLEEHEIRKALAEAMDKKLDYSTGQISADDCWFEALDSEGDDIPDVTAVCFCHRTSGK